MLATPTAADILDDPEYDTVLLAIWAFIAGGLYGFVGYFVVGFALYFGVRLLGSLGDFRRARQTVGFALVPLAASLFVLLPLRLAVYGGDTFRGGGADEGAGERALLVVQLAFAAWSLALVVVGVRVAHGWTWLRALRRPLLRGRSPSGAARRVPDDLRRRVSKSRELVVGHRVRVLLLGKRRSRTSAANSASADADRVPDLGVALDEARGAAVVQAEEVVPDEHLAVAVRPCADPDRGDREIAG